jgi:SAM-dependent methyltransferase
MTKKIVSKYWTHEYIKGFFRNFTSNSIHANQTNDNAVSLYFNKISDSYYQKKHEASNDSLICSYIKSNLILREQLLTNKPIVYDLGSGYGDIYECIDFPQNSTINLVDFSDKSLSIAKKKIDGISNVKTELINLNEWESKKNDAQIVLCINVIPYISDINSLIERISNSMLKDSIFILLYPTRSPVWEDYFEKISLIYHDPKKISDISTVYNLKIVSDESINFHFTKPFSFIKKSIGKLTVFKKT